jgi:hypothetical protein
MGMPARSQIRATGSSSANRCPAWASLSLFMPTILARRPEKRECRRTSHRLEVATIDHVAWPPKIGLLDRHHVLRREGDRALLNEIAKLALLLLARAIGGTALQIVVEQLPMQHSGTIGPRRQPAPFQTQWTQRPWLRMARLDAQPAPLVARKALTGDVERQVPDPADDVCFGGDRRDGAIEWIRRGKAERQAVLAHHLSVRRAALCRRRRCIVVSSGTRARDRELRGGGRATGRCEKFKRIKAFARTLCMRRGPRSRRWAGGISQVTTHTGVMHA